MRSINSAKFRTPAYADRALVKKQGEPMTPDEIKTAINQF